MPEVSATSVSKYWNGVTPSILGPYMMDGFGLPASAGRFRFKQEINIVERLINRLNCNSAVLDLGCGMGYWAQYFAQRFSQVDAVEGSHSLYQTLKEQCISQPNINAIHANAMTFEPENKYGLIFLGGLLMYLDQQDVITLLHKLIPFLDKGGMILCRESTVRGQTLTCSGDYSAVYRPVTEYQSIFKQSGLSLRHVERNEAYVLMQMGCEWIKPWKKYVPKPLQALRLVGRINYWGLRLGNPWIQRVPKALRIPYPKLENHFFVLEATSGSTAHG